MRGWARFAPAVVVGLAAAPAPGADVVPKGRTAAADAPVVADAPDAAAAAPGEIVVVPPRSTEADGVEALRRAAADALDAGDDDEAARRLDLYLERRRDDALMLYNAACVHCRRGDVPRARTLLLDAIKAGYHDFSHMRRDADLEPLRADSVFRAIVAARDAADPIIAERRRARWEQVSMPLGYRIVTDDARRIDYLTTLDDAALAVLRGAIEARLDDLAGSLFPVPVRHAVLVAIVDERHRARFVGDARAHGRYRHGARELVSTLDDRAMAHELVHVLHHDHMDALAQDHPIWIQEGLAALLESYGRRDDGTIAPRDSERDDLVRTLADEEMLMPWRDLFALDAAAFRSSPLEAYAQVRSVLAYVAAQGALEAWYERYTETYDLDAAGAHALEIVLGTTIDEAEARWRAWIDERGDEDLAPDTFEIAPVIAALPEASMGPAPAAVDDDDGAVPQRHAEVRETARALYDEGRFEDAIDTLEALVAEAPSDADGRYLLALACVRVGRVDDARVQHDVLMALDASLASLLANLLLGRTEGEGSG